MIQHLITLIQDEDLAISEAKILVSDKGIQSTWSGHNDVRVCLFVLQDFGILLNGSSTIKDCCLHIGHIFAEAGVLILNLVCKLTGMAHDEDRGLTSDRLDLLESGENKDGSLTETRFGLAKDIGSEDGLRNANLLDCRVNRAEVR